MGHGGGALAAQTVVETTEQIWRDVGDRIDSEEFLRALALKCHEAVNAAGEKFGQEPRTTLVALLIERGVAVSVHAGDSRVIQFSGQRLVSRTVDHSIGQLNVLRGKITERGVGDPPRSEEAVLASRRREHYRIWNSSAGKLTEGRRFVVCSDGFWEVFPPEQNTGTLQVC